MAIGAVWRGDRGEKDAKDIFNDALIDGRRRRRRRAGALMLLLLLAAAEAAATAALIAAADSKEITFYQQ